MNISVIICTFNRSHNLADCLEHLKNQLVGEKLDWEIIIIDNNSTDDTQNVVEDYKKSSTLNIRYIFEGKQGLSYARNTGIKISKGEYLVFIDDDIKVSPNWLQSIYTSFKEQNCDAVGGRIHIDSDQRLPSWITPELYGFLGHQDFGDNPHTIDGINQCPFGGNMAIHRRVIEMIGYFNIGLGRKGEGFKKEELFKGEETEFFSRLAAAKGKLYYHPDALVYHKILPHQLEKTFFLNLHHNAGIQQTEFDSTIYRRNLFGIPLFVIGQLIRSIYRYATSVLIHGIDNSFRKLMNIYYFLGMIEGYITRHFQR